MTWKYKSTTDGATLKIWDHTQDPTTDTPLTTISNDGSGFTIPDDILDVMDSEAKPELPSQAVTVTGRGATILREMARRDIQEYTG